ncbi:MAG: hypothetical protein M3R25_15750 [Bacteroidota bacterium]|nr:hypothetical protein [Bacteroidota bacterium]
MKDSKDKYIEEFGSQIEHYDKLMAVAFESVINEGISKYPVFIFHQQDVTVGIQIAVRHDVAGDWSVNISTLEEFYIKGLVMIEQVDEIKAKISGTPQVYCCLVISGEQGSLIFLPRTKA